MAKTTKTSKWRVLYDHIRGDYNLSSYDDFLGEMTQPGEAGYQNRLRLFNRLKDDDWDVGDSYEEFKGRMGIHAVPGAASGATAAAAAASGAGAVTVPAAAPTPTRGDEVRAQRETAVARPSAGETAGDESARAGAQDEHELQINPATWGADERGRLVDEGKPGWVARDAWASTIDRDAQAYREFWDVDGAGKRKAFDELARSNAAAIERDEARKELEARTTGKMRDAARRVRNRAGVQGAPDADDVKAQAEHIWEGDGSGRADVVEAYKDYLRRIRYSDDERELAEKAKSMARWGGLDETGRAEIEEACKDYLRRSGYSGDELVLGMAAKQMAKDMGVQAAYDEAKERNKPQNWVDFLGKKAMDTSLLGTVEKAVRRMTGRGKDAEAREAAMAEHSEAHPYQDVLFTVIGMGMDPTMLLSGYAGGAIARGLTVGAGKIFGESVSRMAANTLMGRIGQHVVSTAANLGIYEGVKEGENQWAHGGRINPDTGENEGYDAGSVLERMGHGARMGAAIGWLGPVTGNVSDKLVRGAKSAAAKTAVRSGVYVGSTMLEGTIFAAPEIYDALKKGDVELAKEAWIDSEVFMAALKGKEAVKSVGEAARQTLGGRDGRRKFAERVRTYMDAPRQPNLCMTPDELEELQRGGYGDITELLRAFDKERKKGAGQRGLMRYVEGHPLAGGDGAGSYVEVNETAAGRVARALDDPHLSESVRSKLNYYVSGELKGASPIMGFETEEMEDGRVAVMGYNARGGVVTRRVFGSHAEALDEVRGLRRQAELNVMQHAEAAYMGGHAERQFEAACEQVAYEHDLPVEVVVTAARAGASAGEAGAETAGASAGIANQVYEVYRLLGGELSPEEALQRLRGSIEARHGMSVDDALSTEPEGRSEQERAVIQAYLDGMGRRRNAVEDVRATEERPKGRGRMRKDGREVEVVSGDVELMDDGSISFNQADETIVVRDVETGKMEMVSPFDLKDYEPYDADREVSGQEVEPSVTSGVRDEAVSEAGVFSGAAADDTADDTAVSSGKYSSSGVMTIRMPDGRLRKAILTGREEDGRHEYYLAGDHSQLYDATDEELDAMVVDYEPDEPMPEPEEAPAPASAEPRGEVSQPGEQPLNTVPERAQNVPTSEENSENAAVSVPTSEENSENAAVSEPAPVGNAPTEQPSKEPTSPTAELSSAAEPAPTPLQRVPKDESGQPIFEAADHETAWDALVEYSEGDAVTAKEIADAMVEEKKKSLDKAQKLKLKGKTPAEMLASKKANASELSKAQQEYEQWERIAKVEQRRKEAERSAVEAEARQRATERAAQEASERAAREEAERIEREALNGVPEWHHDTPENARARGFRRYNGQKWERQEPLQVVGGKEVEVKFSSTDLPKGRVAVIEASQLQPSHIQGERNPLFFIEEAQPKNRTDDVSRMAAMTMAENIRPEEITGSATAYTGAPTVNARGEVIQGNNRSDALRYLWGNPLKAQQDAYKQYLIDNAEQFGIDPAAVEQMRQPVLVNMLDVDDAEANRLGQLTAQDTESGGIERIKAKNVAQKLGEKMRQFANMLLRSEEDEASFGQLIDRNGAEVLKWMSRIKAITPTQYQSAFDSKGNITPEAKNDLSKVLYQAVFKGANQQLEDLFEKLPAKAQRAILSTAFRDLDSPFSQRMLGDLQASVLAYEELMSDPNFADAKKMEEVERAVQSWRRQTALDDRLDTVVPADNYSNFALRLAAMYKASDYSQKTIATIFNDLYDLIQGTVKPDLFDLEPDKTPRTLAKAIKEKLKLEYQPAKNDIANGRNRSADVALDNQASEGGQRGGSELPAGGEPAALGAEPTERGGGASDDSSEATERAAAVTGQREQQSVEAASAAVDTNPTDAQKEAGSLFDVAEAPLPEGMSERYRGNIFDDLVSAFNRAVFGTNDLSVFEIGVEAVEAERYERFKQAYKDIAGEYSYGKDEPYLKSFYDYFMGKLDKAVEKRKEQTAEASSPSKKRFVDQETVNAYENEFGKDLDDKTQSKIKNLVERILNIGDAKVDDKDEYIDEICTVECLPNDKKFVRSLQIELEQERLSGATWFDKETGTRYDLIITNGQYKGQPDKITAGRTRYKIVGEKNPKGTTIPVAKPGGDVKGLSGEGYSIAAKPYTNKQGKTLETYLVTFDRDFSREEMSALRAKAKGVKGWYDREAKGWMLRSAEDAKAFAEDVMGKSEDEVADEAPLSVKGDIEPAIGTVDTMGLMAAIKVGFTVTPRDFTTNMPPTPKRKAIGLVSALLKSKSEEELEEILSDNGYPKELAGALMRCKELYKDGSKSINELADMIATVFEGDNSPGAEGKGETRVDKLAQQQLSTTIYRALKTAKGESGYSDSLSAAAETLGRKLAEPLQGSEWWRSSQAVAKVRSIIADTLDIHLPKEWGKEKFQTTVERVFDAITEGKNVIGKKEPTVSRVDIKGEADELRKNGSAKLSDHSEPIEQAKAGDAAMPGAEAPGTVAEAKAKKRNKWISDEDAAEYGSLMDDLRRELGGGDVVEEEGAGYGNKPQAKPMNAEVLRKGVAVTYLMMKGGLRKFSDYCEAMVDELGDAIRPHLKSLYAATQNMEEVIEAGWDEEMDDRKTVKGFDVYNFDKRGPVDFVETAEHVVNERASGEAVGNIISLLRNKRNEQRRKEADKTSASTRTIVGEAEAVASEVENQLKGATDAGAAEALAERIDKSIEKVNEQLALLGYYEADAEDKDYNEAYGYMRNAEREQATEGAASGLQPGEDIVAMAERVSNSASKPKEQTVKPEQTMGGLFDDLSGEHEDAESEMETAFVEEVLKRLGREKMNITTLRKIAKDLGLEGRIDTDLQELTELAIVKMAREIANKAATLRDGFNQIVELYKSQPTISQRSSERVAKQQYSTPIPLGYMADAFINAIQPKSVLEPSGGNGMMIHAIAPGAVHANDIDKMRLKNLRRQGFARVTDQDGREAFKQRHYHAIVTNPPFGQAKAVDYDGFPISGLEKQMSINALNSMRDDGRAAIIIGGNTEYDEKGRIKGADRIFFNYLYSRYNVVDVINISGDMYSRQGTSYPVRMILIDGRRPYPAQEYAPRRAYARAEQVTTFEELFNRINDELLRSEELSKAYGDSRGEQGGRSISEGGDSRADDISRRDTSVSDDDRERRKSDAPIGGYSAEHGNGARPAAGGARRAGGGGESVDGGAATGGSGRGASAERKAKGRASDTGDGGNDGGDRGRSADATNVVVGAGEGAGRVTDSKRLAEIEAERQQRKEDKARRESNVRRTLEENPDVGAVEYISQSNAREIGSTVPANQAQPISDALKRMGDVDEFVRQQLGYADMGELYAAMSAEQIDSVALCITQMANGKGFIIGDMTGVGKGRQAAAIIRWAVKAGHKPIFMTEKANLFSDIYRDLTDIGSGELRPLIINADKDADITDSNGKVVHRAPRSGNKALKRILESGKIPDEYDFVIMTYSQLSAKDMNAKKTFFMKIAAGNYLVMDESHNAGGDGNTGTFLQNILSGGEDTEGEPVRGVTFLSGTFAKRPDNMPIYALKTDIGNSGLTADEMIQTIIGGGVPLQEIMSRALASSGQMVRRERDFTGVTVDWTTIGNREEQEKQERQYDSTIGLFNRIIQFQEKYVTPIIEMMDEEIAEQGKEAGGKKGTKKGGVDNPPLFSKTFLVTRQLMFAMKADAVADMVIEQLKQGKKPVVAVDNTMESFADGHLPNTGEFEMPTIAMSYEGHLESCMQYTIKDAQGEETHRRLSLEQLPPEGRAEYNKIIEEIHNATDGVFLSPIDRIKARVRAAGYSVAELTGRKYEIQETTEGRYSKVSRTDTDKKKSARDFNNGDVDVLILNKSASTGISLHSSEQFGDQRQRVMIIAQPQLDVNTEVQMRGRIDRTGQIWRGHYIYAMCSVPAESRLIMMLKAKLKSLDANTKSSQKSEVSDESIVDFLNKYGDEICLEYLKEHRELTDELYDPLHFEGKAEDEINAMRATEGMASRICGRIALLSTSRQREFYDEIGRLFTEKINYLDEIGENELVISSLPLAAETKAARVFQHGTDPGKGNEFAEDSIMEECEVNVLRKPLKMAEIQREQERLTGGYTNSDEYKRHLHSVMEEHKAAEIALLNERLSKKLADAKMRKEASIRKEAVKLARKSGREIDEAEVSAVLEDAIAIVEKEHAEKADKMLKAVNSRYEATRGQINSIQYFDTCTVPNKIGIATSGSVYAYVMGVKIPNAGSKLTLVCATLDGRRKVEIPFSDELSMSDVYRSKFSKRLDLSFPTASTWDRSAPTATRETMYIATGNLLQAYPRMAEGSKIVNFTDKDGNIRQGIIMPKWAQADAGKLMTNTIEPFENIGEAVAEKKKTFSDTHDEVTLGWNQLKLAYELEVPKSKTSGGKYYLDEGLKSLLEWGGNFQQRRGRFVAVVKRENVAKVAKYLSDKFNLKVYVPIEGEASAREPGAGYGLGGRKKIVNFASRYETQDGKTINYTSENPEAYGVSEAGAEYGRGDSGARRSNVQRKNSALLATRHDQLGEGEYSHIERIFRESNAFEFTSGEKVKSAADVAFIFEQLENASVENAFVVLVKRGRPTVLHLSMGGFAATMVNTPVVKEAAARIKPDQVYFVHNHPSGELKCSLQDVNSLRNIERAIGMGVEGVIVNLKSGKYGTFGTREPNETHDKAAAPNVERRLRLYAFDRHVFAPDYDPATPVEAPMNAEDVAKYISSHRLGARGKISYLIRAHNGGITANIHSPYTEISYDNMHEVADDIISHITNFGGTSAFIYGDYDYVGGDANLYTVLNKVVRERSGESYQLVDAVRVGGLSTWSAQEIGLMEPGAINERQAQMAEAGAEGKRRQAESMSARLHTPVRIVEDEEEITDADPERQAKMRRARGWYDTGTGEVVINLARNRNVGDVAETMLHEVVGHKGLRELVGEDGYSAFMRDVYEHCKTDVKKKIAEKAARHGWDFEKATDEYLGELSEKGFEDFTEGERSIWEKLKEKVLSAINKLLKGIRLPKWVRLGDNELRYMLWKSMKNLEGRTEGDYVRKAEDIAKRKELRVGTDVSYREGEETEDLWKDRSVGLQERITNAAVRLAARQGEDLEARNDAIRAIGSNLSDLRRAMSQQRKYDISTVKRVGDLARILIAHDYLSDMGKGEVKRLISAVKNSVGRESVTESVNTIMDIMVANQLRNAEAQLKKLERIKGSKTDSRGVEVQAGLDVKGQLLMQVFRKTRGMSEELIQGMIERAQERMEGGSTSVAEEAAVELEALDLAQRFNVAVAKSEGEEYGLRDELREANERKREEAEAEAERLSGTLAKLKEDMASGKLTQEAYVREKSAAEVQFQMRAEAREAEYHEFVEATEDAIRQNMIERAEAYNDIALRVAYRLWGSMAEAQEFARSKRERVEEMHHYANSDMQGRPSNEHYQDGITAKLNNNTFARLLLAPLATFEQMLRTFGNKSANGEGYLWNKLVRGWVDSRNRELRGVESKYAQLDAKASEIFGKGTKWSDLIRRFGSRTDSAVTFRDGGELREHRLTQNNMLYIYMADKMSDGRMKLRRMGITAEDVERVTSLIDPRLVKLADWVQGEFLVGTRDEYNETHKRVYGASMASIENYFPLRILANARTDKEEDVNQQGQPKGITTKTGAIITRTRNGLALDVTRADALMVVLEHVAEMEHWNAFAEWNESLNALRTYKRFRNQVYNMNTTYGSGEQLWSNFNDACLMAAGEYKPPRAKLDEAAVNIAKGATAACVNARMFTAIKQLLSLPAYIPEVSVSAISKSLVNPYGAFKWCMENIPIFKERWRSRIAGDPRLMKTNMDWSMWRSRIVELASRVGMSPNAFMDIVAVSIGAKAIYETRREQYIREGYDAAAAEERAKQDAAILPNQTQQSSEAVFLSTMQVDRSWLSTTLTCFRNASMSYQRQLHDALRNIKRNLTPGSRGAGIEFMAKQLLRDWGIDPATAESDQRMKARAAAKGRMNRQLRKDALRVLTFGYILQALWNLGAYLPYLLFGDDDEKKKELSDDALAHAMFGAVEGFAGGDVLSAGGNMAVKGEWVPTQLSKDMPLVSEIDAVKSKFASKRYAEAVNDIINVVVMCLSGVNPQSITDTVEAIIDACGGDASLGHEAALFWMRVLQVPQSQLDKIYFDEVGLRGDEAGRMTPGELARRYARYKLKRGTVFIPEDWIEEGANEREEAAARKKMREELMESSDGATVEAYKELKRESEEAGERWRAAKRLFQEDYVTGAEALEREKASYAKQSRFNALDKGLDELTGKWLNAKTPEEAVRLASATRQYRSAMVRALKSESDEERGDAIKEIQGIMREVNNPAGVKE